MTAVDPVKEGHGQGGFVVITAQKEVKNVKLGLIVYSNDAETVWNAFRLGNYALKEGDEVKAFLSGKGVESETIDTDTFKVTEQMRSFVEGGGAVFACGTCLKIRQSTGTETCPMSTLADLYEIVEESDKIITY